MFLFIGPLAAGQLPKEEKEVKFLVEFWKIFLVERFFSSAPDVGPQGEYMGPWKLPYKEGDTKSSRKIAKK